METETGRQISEDNTGRQQIVRGSQCFHHALIFKCSCFADSLTVISILDSHLYSRHKDTAYVRPTRCQHIGHNVIAWAKLQNSQRKKSMAVYW
jgi:hypothetical protein